MIRISGWKQFHNSCNRSEEEAVEQFGLEGVIILTHTCLSDSHKVPLDAVSSGVWNTIQNFI